MSAQPTGSSPSVDTYPRRAARTGRFTFGSPRAFAPSAGGERVAFLRSAGGTTRATALWVLDVASGTERLVADPVTLLAGSDEELPAQERSRRERSREGGAGITAFSTDLAGQVAAFALSSGLFVCDLTGPGGCRELATAAPAVDPRMSPDGRFVAYVGGAGVHVVGARPGTAGQALAEAEGPQVFYGLAEFVAAEELGRHRGMWWSPESDALLVTRVDESAVQVWHIANPAAPATAARQHRYPAAGTANAEVTLWLLALDGNRREIVWDRATYPYLASVTWPAGRPPLLAVLSRRQDRSQVLSVDIATATATVVRELTDPHWLEIAPGTPAWGPGGEVVTVEVVADRYALCLDSRPVSPVGVQVRAVADLAGDALLAVGTEGADQHVYRLAHGDWSRLTAAGSVNAARAAADVAVLTTATAASTASRTSVLRPGPAGRWEEAAVISTLVEDPGFTPVATTVAAADRPTPTVFLLPSGWTPQRGPLPVLLNPYGGPHGRLVQPSARGYLESQWWADQGFAVIVADGRGTPGAPSWERAVHHDLAGPPLDDQVAALAAVAAAHPGVLDLDRVGIRGWSFGGYLAALAVLQRPEVFHAAIAGAPVVDWRLYDTAYTERYLGLPEEHPEAYEASSLVAMAPGLRRPLMIIHGLADDNVVAAHSLRLSTALLEAGRPHTFLPLAGVTHMTPQESVAENLLLLQLDFLRSALGA